MNGTIVMPCVPGTQCTLDKTWAAERGGRTEDRVGLDVSSCSDGVSRAATLTSDRRCSAASTAAMVAGADAGTIRATCFPRQGHGYTRRPWLDWQTVPGTQCTITHSS